MAIRVKLILFVLGLCLAGMQRVVSADDSTSSPSKDTPIEIGWIGPMTGPISKYAAYQSAQLAEEEINASGGIRGRKLKLIFEDGKGEGKSAATSAMKLINVDKVKYIVGGHCSPESLAIAPLAERSKTVMLAAITSNPMMTTAGDYIFRITAVSTKHAELLVPFAVDKRKLKRFVIIHEETDYARPAAERFASLVKESGRVVLDTLNYNPGETDFRTMLTRVKSKQPDAIYIGIQAPDSAVLIFQQLRELKISSVFFGNELTGNAVLTTKQPELFNGLIFAEPKFDPESPESKTFIENYKKRFHVDALPFGIWTAEAYDAVRVLTNAIASCGDEVESVKRCLYQVQDFAGASGKITIDKNGDGVRTYVIKEVRNGQIIPVAD